MSSTTAYASVSDIITSDAKLRKQFGEVKRVRTLENGAKSLVDLVTAQRGAFVLKRKVEEGHDYTTEYENLKRYARTGFTPKAYHHGALGKTAYIAIEYIKGPHLHKRRVSPKDLQAMTDVLTKILRPAPGETPIAQKLSRDAAFAKTWIHEAQQYEALRPLAIRAEKCLEQIPPAPDKNVRKRYRHGDPNPNNFIRNGKRLFLIDWDGNNPPVAGEIELADLALKGRLGVRSREALVARFPWCERDVFEAAYQYRLSGLIGWHFERFVLNEQGKFNQPFYGGSFESEWRALNDNIDDLERALK